MVDLVERFGGHVVYALECHGPIPLKLALELLCLTCPPAPSPVVPHPRPSMERADGSGRWLRGSGR